jgi:hypothetical protein
MDWAAFRVCLENGLLGNPLVDDEEAIDTRVEELTSVIQEVVTASTP